MTEGMRGGTGNDPTPDRMIPLKTWFDEPSVRIYSEKAP
jgi:hypothetical protein